MATDQAAPVTLDLSKSVPISTTAPDAPPNVTLDLSKSVPLPSSSQSGQPGQPYDLATTRAAGGGGPLDVATGLAKKPLELAAGVGELIHAIPKVGPAIIPAEGLKAEENIAEPKNLGESAGGFIGDAAIYGGGEAAVSGVLKGMEILSKLPASVRLIAEAHPKLLKSLTTAMESKPLQNIGKAAAVGGAQGAVEGAAEGGGDSSKAIEGAEHGGATGALGAAGGTALLEGAIPAAKKIGEAVGVGTTAEQDISRALQPAKRNYGFLPAWDASKDRIVDDMAANGKFDSMKDFADRLQDARQKLWTDEYEPIVKNHASENLFPALNGKSPLAGAIEKQATDVMEATSPENAKKIREFAKRFDRPVTVKEADALIGQMNGELDDLGYWDKTPPKRAAAVKANPEIASRVAATDFLREKLIDHLASEGETSVQDLKTTYGGLKNLENEARGQIPVQGRQRGLSLKVLIGLASQEPTGIAAALLDKLYNDPTALINRAVRKEAPPGAIKAAAKDIASGAGTAAKKGVAVAGEKILYFTSSDGKLHAAPANQKDAVLEKYPGAKFE